MQLICRRRRQPRGTQRRFNHAAQTPAWWSDRISILKTRVRPPEQTAGEERHCQTFTTAPRNNGSIKERDLHTLERIHFVCRYISCALSENNNRTFYLRRSEEGRDTWKVSLLLTNAHVCNLQIYFLLQLWFALGLTRPEALPAGLTAVMNIYTRMGLLFCKPRRSSHLFLLPKAFTAGLWQMLKSCSCFAWTMSREQGRKSAGEQNC